MGRTRHPDEPHPGHGRDEAGTGGETEQDSGRSAKKIDLSVSRVAGAGAATLTAATAASYLDVYGTVIGAAVIAILSTTVSPLLAHWFSRSGEQAKQLAGKAVAPRALTQARATPVAATVSTDTDAGLDADATRTMAIPALAPDGEQDTTRVDGHGGAVDPEATVLLPAQDPGGPQAAEDGEDGDTGGLWDDAPTPRRRGWRAVLIPAALVFTAVMLVILVFELVTGRSLTSWTQGTDEPTSPSIVGGNSAPPAEEEEPVSEDGVPDTEEPPAEDPGTTERGPVEQPGPEDPAATDPAAPGEGTGESGGERPPEQGGQETDPPTEEEPTEEPGGSVPPPREPDDENTSVPELD